MDKLNFYVTVKMTFDHSEEDIFAIGTVIQIHGDFPFILNYLENYVNNTLIMNWSHSSYQCSANSDDSCNFVNELWDNVMNNPNICLKMNFIFLDIGLYELCKMTIISDIEHITVNSNFNWFALFYVTFSSIFLFF